MKLLLFLLVTSCCLCISAANIVWGSFFVEGNWGPIPYQGAYLVSDFMTTRLVWAAIGVDPHMSGNSVALSAWGNGDMLPFYGAVVETALGDIIDESLFSTRNDFYEFAMQGREAPAETVPVTKQVGDTFYFAVIFEDFEEAYYFQHGKSTKIPSLFYGWIELEVNADGTLTVLNSAIDLDGGAMLTGGGLATPEPSSALLLFVGVGLLALRRRRAAR